MAIGTDITFVNEDKDFVVQLGEAATKGAVIAVADNGKGYLACAAGDGTNAQPALGVAEVNGGEGDWITVKVSGHVKVTGLTPGAVLYLSDTPGKISTTPGTNEQVIGVAIRADEYLLDVNSLYGYAAAAIDAMPLGGGTFSGDVTMGSGVNIITNTTTGTKIGVASDQKVGFFGKTAVVQPANAAQAAVSVANEDGDIGNLTFTTPTQGEVEALRDKCEILADDVRAIGALLNQLRGDLVTLGLVKGEA